MGIFAHAGPPDLAGQRTKIGVTLAIALLFQLNCQIKRLLSEVLGVSEAHACWLLLKF